MRCHECDAPLPGSGRWCGACGARVQLVDPVSDDAAPTVLAPRRRPAAGRAVVAALVLVLAAAAGLAGRGSRSGVEAPAGRSAGEVVADQLPLPRLPAVAAPTPAPAALDGERWRTDPFPRPVAVPAVSSDRVYVAAATGVIAAFDAVDGVEVWRSDARASKLEPVGVAVADAAVVSTWESGLVVALGADDGRVLWNTTVSSPARPVIAGDAVLLVTRWSGGRTHVVALDLATGQRQDAGDALGGERVVASGPTIVSIDPDGRLAWERTVVDDVLYGPGARVSPPEPAALDGGLVLRVLADGRVAAVSPPKAP